MFCLIRYDNDEYAVVPAKRVTIGTKNKVIVKCGGGRFSAKLISKSNSQKLLSKEKQMNLAKHETLDSKVLMRSGSRFTSTPVVQFSNSTKVPNQLRRGEYGPASQPNRNNFNLEETFHVEQSLTPVVQLSNLTEVHNYLRRGQVEPASQANGNNSNLEETFHVEQASTPVVQFSNSTEAPNQLRRGDDGPASQPNRNNFNLEEMFHVEQSLTPVVQLSNSTEVHNQLTRAEAGPASQPNRNDTNLEETFNIEQSLTPFVQLFNSTEVGDQLRRGEGGPVSQPTSIISNLEEKIDLKLTLKAVVELSNSTEVYNQLRNDEGGPTSQANLNDSNSEETFRIEQISTPVNRTNAGKKQNGDATDSLREIVDSQEPSTSEGYSRLPESLVSDATSDPTFRMSEINSQSNVEQMATDSSTSLSTIPSNSNFENRCGPVDVRTVRVPKSSGRECKTKKHFCPFCKTLQSKFARHLILKHQAEQEVKSFRFLQKKSPERSRIINTLRKRGDFIHNTTPDLNTGILILPRQQQKVSDNSVDDYVCCKSCKGFFSRISIRFHYSRCNKPYKEGCRNNTSIGRSLTGFIHPRANDMLREIIFPKLRVDDIAKIIRYDELVILFGNALCEKYGDSIQNRDMMRAHLRLLGRFKFEIVKMDNSLNELGQIFDPSHFEKSVDALRIVSKWDPKIMGFRNPAAAQNLSTLIRKCYDIFKSQCIIKKDSQKAKYADDFMHLWKTKTQLINKKAVEDQANKKRQKKVALPSKQDIKTLFDYLKNECRACLSQLEGDFNFDAWTLLNQVTLILVQIFNRRRAGEIERLTMANYNNKQVLNENIDREAYANLSESTRQFAEQFARIELRGKLGRTVSVLLSPMVVRSIDTILKFRNNAGIKLENVYIFGVPTTNPLQTEYLRACPLLRRFANESGAIMPRTLTGTLLRKHIATYTSMLNVEEAQIDQLANFMGHHKDIHKTIYRIPVPVTEITQVSRLLMSAIGEKGEKLDGDEEINDDEESDDDECDEAENELLEPQSKDTSASAMVADDVDHHKTILLPTTESDQDEAPLNVSRLSIARRRNFRLPSTPQKNATASTSKASRFSGGNIKLERNGAASASKSSELCGTKTKRRSTSPFGKTKRTRWTLEERDILERKFGNLLMLSKLPSLSECTKLIKDNWSVLNHRNPQQIKTFIDNQRRSDSRKEAYAQSRNIH